MIISVLAIESCSRIQLTNKYVNQPAFTRSCYIDVPTVFHVIIFVFLKNSWIGVKR